MRTLLSTVLLLSLGLSLCACVVEERPPPGEHPGAHWVPGHYGPYGGWVPGHWAP